VASHRLYRSRSERMLAGVCGGLGEYFDVDPSLVRLFFIVATIFTGGLMVLVYLAMGIIVPEQPPGPVGEECPQEAEPEGMASGASGPLPHSFGTGGIPRFTSTTSAEAVHHRRRWAGWALVALGVLVLLSNLNLLSWIDLRTTWPVFLIIAGLLLLLRRDQ